MEISFQLDSDGRTSCAISDSESGSPNQILDYSCKVVYSGLSKELNAITSDTFRERIIDDLIFDCEILDFAILPRTFWIFSTGKPRCRIEQCALEIFHRHIPDGFQYDVNNSGAEWWAQIRPSPPSGRYSVLAQDCDNDDEMYNAGINFHWDKDEDLRILMDGTMYIHPHISTVTYLTNIGAPTIALNYRIHPLDGSWITPETIQDAEAFISWPKCGKHFSFDGRYLHAAPSDLMEKGLFEKQIQLPIQCTDESEITRHTRRHRRVTFLVNIWLNHKPFNVEEFPESMIDKLSKMDSSMPYTLFDATDSKTFGDPTLLKNVTVSAEDTTSNQQFAWPMGGDSSKEKLQVVLPIEDIRQEMINGGSLSVKWTFPEGVQLLNGSEEQQEHAQKRPRTSES